MNIPSFLWGISNLAPGKCFLGPFWRTRRSATRTTQLLSIRLGTQDVSTTHASPSGALRRLTLIRATSHQGLCPAHLPLPRLPQPLQILHHRPRSHRQRRKHLPLQHPTPPRRLPHRHLRRQCARAAPPRHGAPRHRACQGGRGLVDGRRAGLPVGGPVPRLYGRRGAHLRVGQDGHPQQCVFGGRQERTDWAPWWSQHGHWPGPAVPVRRRLDAGAARGGLEGVCARVRRLGVQPDVVPGGAIRALWRGGRRRFHCQVLGGVGADQRPGRPARHAPNLAAGGHFRRAAVWGGLGPGTPEHQGSRGGRAVRDGFVLSPGGLAVRSRAHEGGARPTGRDPEYLGALGRRAWGQRGRLALLG